MTPGTFHVRTFGCQMNVRDSEIMAGLLEARGMRAAGDVRDADIVVVNTCHIREHAESRALSYLGRLRAWRGEAPGRVLVLAGCVGEALGRSLLSRFPHLDVVVGPARVPDLPALLDAARDGHAPVVATGGTDTAGVPEFPGGHPSRFRAWIKIMEGCDHRCAFCVVPDVRGRERSRPFAEVVAEAEALAAGGVVEIGLLGQTVNAYGKKAGPDADFAALLRRLAAVPGLRRIRFTSPHPSYHHDRVLRAMAECPAVMPHMHLPVQSGSDAVLRAMRRGYDVGHFLGIVERARALVPGLAVTTDLIVGFPGETDADFEATLALVRAADFDGAFTFKYSARPGTPAAGLAGQLPEEVKEERLARLNGLLDAGSRRRNGALVGTTQEVLLEGRRGRDAAWQGRLPSNRLAFFEPDAGCVAGTFRRVEITEAGSWTLSGRLVPAARAAAARALVLALLLAAGLTAASRAAGPPPEDLYRDAVAAYGGGDFAAAEAKLEPFRSDHADHRLAWPARLLWARCTADPAESERRFRELALTAPAETRKECELEIAFLMVLRGKHAEAERAYAAFVDANPYDERIEAAKYWRAVCLRALGRTQDASLVAGEEWLKGRQERWRVLSALLVAGIRSESGDHPGARILYVRASSTEWTADFRPQALLGVAKNARDAREREEYARELIKGWPDTQEADEARALIKEPPRAARRFAVQVGAFTQAGNAASERRRWTKKGMKVVVLKRNHEDFGELYHVYIGPYPNRDRAEEVAEKIRRGGTKCNVTAY